jgi:CobQ-like glutamine amidotransferase family enzyme
VSLFQPEPRGSRNRRQDDDHREPGQPGREWPAPVQPGFEPEPGYGPPGAGPYGGGPYGQRQAPPAADPYEHTRPIYQHPDELPPGTYPARGLPVRRVQPRPELPPAAGQPAPRSDPPSQAYPPQPRYPAQENPAAAYPEDHGGAPALPPRRYAAPQVPAAHLFEPAPARSRPDDARLPARREDPFANGSPGQVSTPARARRSRESTTRIALIYPELLGTYGDGGNAIVLAQRLRWRGMAAEVVSVPAGEPVPESCDIYLLGGGEDEPQTLAAEGLLRNNAITRAVDSGAAVLAVCAGYQVIGATFPAGGKIYDGLGLIGVETRRSFEAPEAPLPPRVVGDIVLDPDPSLRLPTVLGYENHGGRTRPLPGVRGVPFGKVRIGLGNGIQDGTDGMVHGTVLGTYLHGPLLAQNPAVADLLLSWVHGELPPLPGPPEVDALRAARLRALEIA